MAESNNTAIIMIIVVLGFLMFSGVFNLSSNTQAIITDEEFPCTTDADCPQCWGRSAVDLYFSTFGSCEEDADCASDSVTNSSCVRYSSGDQKGICREKAGCKGTAPGGVSDDCQYFEVCVKEGKATMKDESGSCQQELKYGKCDSNKCQISEYCINSKKVDEFIKDKPLAFIRHNPALFIAALAFIIIGLFFLKK